MEFSKITQAVHALADAVLSLNGAPEGTAQIGSLTLRRDVYFAFTRHLQKMTMNAPFGFGDAVNCQVGFGYYVRIEAEKV